MKTSFKVYIPGLTGPVIVSSSGPNCMARLREAVEKLVGPLPPAIRAKTRTEGPFHTEPRSRTPRILH